MAAIRGLKLIRGAQAAPVLTTTRARRDNEAGAPAAGAAVDAAGDVMTVEFSRFDTWYEIDSWYEGRFLERTARGAFKRTIKATGAAGVKVLFNHGRDMQIHQKALGVADVLEERDTSPYMEVPLLDTSYNRDLIPGLRAGAYGSSFMFEVVREDWNHDPGVADHNPDGLPERTIKEVRLFEAGPVTWPANPDSTAGLRSVRSGVDWLMESFGDQEHEHREDLVRSFAAFRAMHGLGTPSDQGPATPSPTTLPVAPAPGPAPARHVDGGLSAAARARRMTLLGVRK
ncbi:HK97 family phage prohead protease [Streptomyces acidiscabies]|uniref:HK97 family phage prohead protease n=1 Tax=Streptomyces acidiscabies TaxID=42234 RepID=A0ABU4M7L2_9ACTN|nr:HK97 family phage prohead protease [Streptomyces acidiscabies]MDX3024064.1 HK97 family phage prohead protease [Streptomyces acidiscabies]